LKKFNDMALEVIGKLVKVMEPVSGENSKGGWVKQEFVVETFETYPKKVCCSLWGDKTEQLRRFPVGTDLKVSINIESREYNERWYTEVRAWKIDAAAATAPAPGGFVPPPAYQAPANPAAPPQPNFQQAPASGGDTYFDGGSDGDDLPF
jgi:hypothetical protein